jgi:hypothetical protein
LTMSEVWCLIFHDTLIKLWCLTFMVPESNLVNYYFSYNLYSFNPSWNLVLFYIWTIYEKYTRNNFVLNKLLLTMLLVNVVIVLIGQHILPLIICCRQFDQIVWTNKLTSIPTYMMMHRFWHRNTIRNC